MPLATDEQPFDVGDRDTEWALETFRPLLKDLHLQFVEEKPTIIKTMDYRNLIVKGMGRCIISVTKKKVPQGKKGYCVFSHNSEYNIYILLIVMDEGLFLDNSLELRIQRKALGIHEFVHCAAIMMSLSRLGSSPNPLINSLRKALSDKLTVTTSEDFTQLLAALGAIPNDDKYPDVSIFCDKHFRTEFEDFKGDYADLYLNFLFPYDLIIEMLGERKLSKFKMLVKEKKSDLSDFLKNIIDEIVEKKAIERNFVHKRFVYFLPILVRECIDSA